MEEQVPAPEAGGRQRSSDDLSMNRRAVAGSSVASPPSYDADDDDIIGALIYKESRTAKAIMASEERRAAVANLGAWTSIAGEEDEGAAAVKPHPMKDRHPRSAGGKQTKPKTNAFANAIGTGLAAALAAAERKQRRQRRTMNGILAAAQANGVGRPFLPGVPRGGGGGGGAWASAGEGGRGTESEEPAAKSTYLHAHIFDKRLEQLQAYKAEHGHLKVKRNENKSLSIFCYRVRRERRDPGGGLVKLTEERIASLDALGFDWSKHTKIKSFEERLEDLRAYKAKHGHIRVKQSEDPSLSNFCFCVRAGRRYPGSGRGVKMTEERIASLEALGFDWAPQQMEDFKACKTEHERTNAKQKMEDESLADSHSQASDGPRHSERGSAGRRKSNRKRKAVDYAPQRHATSSDVRLKKRKACHAQHGYLGTKQSEDVAELGSVALRARRCPEGSPPTKREKDPNVRWERRLEELRAYKATHGHLEVERSEDTSLARFCANVKNERRHPGGGLVKLTKGRIAALDALGFDWAMGQTKKTFGERLKELKAHKRKHGHLRVKHSEDASLSKFCNAVRRARRCPDKSTKKITAEQIAALDALGFEWAALIEKKSFEERLEELTSYKAKCGHTNVKQSEDKSLAIFCANAKGARKNPGSGMMKLTKERIAALDAICFDWTLREVKSFEEWLKELKTYKTKHGHLRVKRPEDGSLHAFCVNVRRARRKGCGVFMTPENIASLDALGFNWAPMNRETPF